MDSMDLIRAGRIRRFFRATKKLDTPYLVSHVTQRAAGKEPLFLEDTDYLTMLGLLKDIAEEYWLKIYAFCFMPNHIHLLLSPQEVNLSDAMRSLYSRYARRFNKKYERKGHLFGGPYRQAVCLDDSYLLTASLYIHQNPIRANLVSHPCEHRWSSCRLYCEDVTPKSFVDSNFVLNLLPKGSVSRKRRYRRLLEESDGMATGWVLEQEDTIERFRSKLASTFPLLFGRLAKTKRIARFSGIDLLCIEELEKRKEALRLGELANDPKSKEAKKYLIEQLISRGYKRCEIAEQLGVSRRTVYNLLHSPG